MKKVAVKTVNTFLNEFCSDETFVKVYPVEQSQFEVQFKTSLTIDEQSLFINRVLSGCFDVMQNYRPEYVSPMIHATIIQMCTNLPVISLKNSRGENDEALMDVDAMEELYQRLGIDDIPNERFHDLLCKMTDHVYDALKWRQKRSIADVESAGSRAVESAMQRLNEILDSFSADDVKNLISYAGILSENTKDLDSGNLIDAILNADSRTAAS